MSSKHNRLNQLKIELRSVLGEKNFEQYMRLMKNWFLGKMVKDRFDEHARCLFHESTVRVHNEFLLAILRYCAEKPSDMLNVKPVQAVAPKPRIKKKISSKLNLSQRFQPAQAKKVVSMEMQPDISMENKLKFCGKEYGLLPDAGMLQGRLLLAAWERGLQKLDDQICGLIAIATEDLLRNIITHTIKHSRGVDPDLKVTCICNFTGNLPQHILDKSQRDCDCTERKLLLNRNHPKYGQRITALDMFLALKEGYSNIHISKALQIKTLERLSVRLYHPDKLEITPS